MTNYPLCLAWNMDIDTDFVDILQQACDIKGIGLLHITPENLRQMSRPILRRDIGFEEFFDRASDTDIRFISLMYWTRDRTCYRINPYEKTVYRERSVLSSIVFCRKKCLRRFPDQERVNIYQSCCSIRRFLLCPEDR